MGCGSSSTYPDSRRQSLSSKDIFFHEHDRSNAGLADLPPEPPLEVRASETWTNGDPSCATLSWMSQQKSNTTQKSKNSYSKQHRKSATAHQVALFNYSPPTPPKTRKCDIFDIKHFDRVDKHASKVPHDIMYGHYDTVAIHLTKHCKSDLEKVRALFVWATVTDVSDLQFTLDQLPDINTPLEYLLQILWKMGNYANLFTQLCRSANIPCVTVYGVTKSAMYQLGARIRRPAMCSQWNAVQIDNTWWLIDLLWATTQAKDRATKNSPWEMLDDYKGHVVNAAAHTTMEDQVLELDTVHHVNEYFFLTDPGELIFTHLPDDEDWQLLYVNVTEEQFEDYAYVRERFWQLKIVMHPDVKQHTVPTHKGDAHFSINIPEEGSADISFRYLLFVHKDTTEKCKDLELEKYVFYEKKDIRASFNVRCPAEGYFKFDIFGKDTAANGDNYDLCVSFLIYCDQPDPNCQPFPDAPVVGWGPGDELEYAGMKALNHDEAVIVCTDGVVELRFAMDNPKNVLENLKSNKLNEMLLKHNAMMQVVDGELVLTLRLAEKGEYALNLFAEDLGKEGAFANVANYLINNLQCHDLKAFPKLYENFAGKGFMANSFGIEALSPDSVIKTEDGKIKLEFNADPDTEMFMELQKNDIDSELLAKFVTHTVDDSGKHTFEINLPQGGEYALNVFARTKGEDGQVYHAHTYLASSTQQDSLHLPPPQQPPDIIAKEVSGDIATIRLPAGAGTKPHTTNLLHKNAHDVCLKDQIICNRLGNEDVYYVLLPEHGEYTFEIFGEDANATLQSVKQYQISKVDAPDGEDDGKDGIGLSAEERRKREETKANEAKHKHYQEKLMNCMELQNIDKLRKVIHEFEALRIPDDVGRIKKAKRLLQDLHKIMAASDAQIIETLPDCPEIGWGLGEEAEVIGLKSITHNESVITTTDGTVEIRFATEEATSMMQALKNNNIDDDLLRRYAMIRQEDGETIVSLRLPEKGDFALNLYAEINENIEAALPNVANFLVKNQNENEIKLFPKIHEAGLGKGLLANKLNVAAKSHTNDMITTDNGILDIEFELPDNFELVCKLHNNDIDGAKLSKCATIKDGSQIILDLPQQGEYGLDVYARDKSNPTQMHHVHTYFINSSQAESDVFPLSSEVDQGVIPIIMDGDVAIIPIDQGMLVHNTEMIRKNGIGGFRANQIQFGDQNVIRVTVDEMGEYRFAIFEDDGQMREYLLIKDTDTVQKLSATTANMPSDDELRQMMAEREQDEVQLPDCPVIGWGPGTDLESAGLKALTHTEPVIDVIDGQVEMRFCLADHVNIIQNIKNNDIDELLLKQNAMMRIDGNEMVVNVRIPQKGEYALNLFSDTAGAEGELPNVCNYLLRALNDNDVKSFPKFHEGGIGKGFLADRFNVVAKSHPDSKIQTELGVVTIEFDADNDVEMLYEVCNNDIDNGPLSDCVKVKNNEGVHEIDLILPKEGEYALNVYARKKGDTKQVYHVHTYFIESFQSDTQNLPPATLPVDIIPIHTTTDVVFIRMLAGKKARTTELLMKNALNQMPHQVKVEYDNKIDIYEVYLPAVCEYRFDVFEELGNGTLDHIKQYQIIRHEPIVNKLSPKEKKAKAVAIEKAANVKAALKKLQAGIIRQDVLALPIMIKDYAALIDNHYDNHDINAARTLLAQLKIAKDLEDAMAKRDLQELQRVIGQAKKANLPDKLGLVYKMSIRIEEKLMVLERLRHEVLKLDNRAIAEIKSYQHPPPPTHDIMQSVFILLGEDPKHILEWLNVVSLLSKTSKGSLKRRLAQFRSDTVKVELAVEAKVFIKELDMDHVREVSEGIATFFQWAQSMIEECEAIFKLNGGDLEAVEAKHARLTRRSEGNTNPGGVGGGKGAVRLSIGAKSSTGGGDSRRPSNRSRPSLSGRSARNSVGGKKPSMSGKPGSGMSKPPVGNLVSGIQKQKH